MSVSLKQLDLENFGEYQQLHVEFDRGVNYLIGLNGSGKSTILNGIWSTMQGMGERGKHIFHSERYRWIGPNGKSAKGQLVLYDEEQEVEIIVKNKMTKDGNHIEFFAKDGILPEDFMDRIWNTFCVDPERFARLDPKDQAVELGIDTSEYDQKIQSLKDERRDVKRDMKNQKSVVEKMEEEGVEEVEHVDVNELLEQKNRIETHNEDQEFLVKVTNSDEFAKFLRQIFIDEAVWDGDADAVFGETVDFEDDQLQSPIGYDALNYEDQRKVLVSLLDWLPEPDPMEDLSEIEDQIQNAQQINRQADRWEKYQEEKAVLDELEAAVETANDQITEVEQEKTEYVQQQELPFKNMSIGEDGGLLLNDRPLQEPYYSQGEIWAAVTRILAKTNPDMVFFFVRNASNLDDKKRKTISALADQGYQPIFEIVGESRLEGGRNIFIREGEVTVQE